MDIAVDGNPFSSELSEAEKGQILDILPYSIASDHARCVGLFVLPIEKGLAERRALKVCSELTNRSSYLSFEVGVRKGELSSYGKVEVSFSKESSESLSLISPPISEKRYFFDQIDTISGFQIKPIYLVPSDREDLRKDMDGTITAYLEEGNYLLESRLGDSFAIDTDPRGLFDIGFISSPYNEKDMSAMIQKGDMKD
jgi:hypothetical protein